MKHIFKVAALVLLLVPIVFLGICMWNSHEYTEHVYNLSEIDKSGNMPRTMAYACSV